MKVEINDREVKHITRALLIAWDSDRNQEVDWDVIAKFMAKLDRGDGTLT